MEYIDNHVGVVIFLFLLLLNAHQDEERMSKLEDDLKNIRTKAEEADKQYDEVSKKLQVGGWS